jgi:hypothetical protein
MILIIVSSGIEKGKRRREQTKEGFKASDNAASRLRTWSNSTSHLTADRNEL